MSDIIWHDAKLEVPIPSNLSESSNEYFLVYTENFGAMFAMRVENENGECVWMKDYTSLLIDPVIKWAKIKD